MPSKRSIILKRNSPTAISYRYVLWADVPAGNQIAYRNPSAASAYENATAAELQAIRTGTVAETTGEVLIDSGTITTVQGVIDAKWAEFQANVTAEALWADYGRYSNSGGTWQASPGVPMYAAKEVAELGLPTYIALSPVSAYGANKFHLVLHNNVGALGECCPVKVRLVAWQPGAAAVTGAAGGLFTLRRRSSPSTPPSGAGSFTIAACDTAQPVPTGIVAYNAPGTSPVGGTSVTINEFTPQADELKLSTLDAPTVSALFGDLGGQTVYRHYLNCRPLTIRNGETLEIQQSATAGAGNGRAIVLFTVG